MPTDAHRSVVVGRSQGSNVFPCPLRVKLTTAHADSRVKHMERRVAAGVKVELRTPRHHDTWSHFASTLSLTTGAPLGKSPEKISMVDPSSSRFRTLCQLSLVHWTARVDTRLLFVPSHNERILAAVHDDGNDYRILSRIVWMDPIRTKPLDNSGRGHRFARNPSRCIDRGRMATDSFCS